MDEDQNPYLWDRTGATDSEIESLERTLAEFRYVARPLEERASRPAPATPISTRRLGRWALAAGAIAAVLAVGFLTIRSRFQWSTGQAWRVVVVEGHPVVQETVVRDAGGELGVGETLETDARSRARLEIGNIGTLTIGPSSRVRLLATRTRHHRIALDYGSIDARTWAPPFSFAVETSSSSLFDLGCAFTLRMDRDGTGVVGVDSGWVEFELGDLQSVVPAGAEAITRPKLGPGTACLRDARPEFKAALAAFDTSAEGSEARSSAVGILLSTSRPQDSITLLNVLGKVERPERERVLDVLTRSVPIPRGVTREEVLDLQTKAMDLYWKELGLGNPKSWLMHWRDVVGD